MKRKMRSKTMIATALIALLAVAISCAVPSWLSVLEADVKIALPIALSLVGVIDPALAPAATLVVSALKALMAAWDEYRAQPTVSNFQKLQAAVKSANDNMAQLAAAAQIHNPATESRVAAIVELLGQLLNEITAQVPATPPTAESLAKAAKANGNPHGADWYKKKFNAIIKGDPRFKPLN